MYAKISLVFGYRSRLFAPLGAFVNVPGGELRQGRLCFSDVPLGSGIYPELS